MSLTISKPAVPSVARIGSSSGGLFGQITHEPAERNIVQELVDCLGWQHGSELEHVPSFIQPRIDRAWRAE